MTLVAIPPIRDHNERCSDCDQWTQHAVSIHRRSTADDVDGSGRPGGYRFVRCLACGATDVGLLDAGDLT